MHVMPMKDMALTPEEAREGFSFPSPSDAPKYPYGLSISLCEKELEKLQIDFDSLCVGDIIHLHALAVINAKSSNQTQDGEARERVELQITHLSSENEDEENQENDEEEDREIPKTQVERISKLYK